MDRNVNMNIHPIDVDTLCGNREEVATMDKERRVLGEILQGFPAERDESGDSCVTRGLGGLTTHESAYTRDLVVRPL